MSNILVEENNNKKILNSDKKIMQSKSSIGIICCSLVGNVPRLLVVSKRYTYAYKEFLYGRGYKASDSSSVIALLSQTTVDEKLDILRLNFKSMWYRIWLHAPKKPVYYASKHLFQITWMTDGGKRLRKLIACAGSRNRFWEFPKGRKKSSPEPDINCAVREFYEETRISKSQYKIIPGEKLKLNFIDAGTRYLNTYYIAYTKYDIKPKISFDNIDQSCELVDIRWMDMKTLNVIADEAPENKRLIKLAQNVFDIVKKRTN